MRWWRYNGFKLSCDIARPPDSRAMGLFKYESLKVSYHPTKFGGNKHCGSGNAILLICHVISEDHVIKGTSNLTATNLLR